MNITVPSSHREPPLGTLDALNRACFCFSLDQDALAQALDSELGQPGLSAMVRERCPYLFSAQPVFVGASQLLRMTEVVRAVEIVVALPAYREQVLAAAPAIARLVSSASLAEGWGLTLTEAAACCTPAVATDVSGHRSSVIDGVTGVLRP